MDGIDFSRRLKALDELRGKISGSSLHLVEALENRLGNDSLVSMMQQSKSFQVVTRNQVDLSGYGFKVGQIAPDGLGSLWVMMYDENYKGRRLLRIDENRNIAESVDISEDSGMHFYMDEGVPLWFDSATLRFVGPGGVQGPDFSDYADVLGPHVYFLRLVRFGPDAYMGLFSTTDRVVRSILCVKGGEASAFLPKTMRLPYDMALLGDVVVVSDYVSAWLYAVNLEGGSVSPYLIQPLSCLFNSMAVGQGNRLWALVNSGHSLALCRNGRVTHFERDLSALVGGALQLEAPFPAFVAVQENESRSIVMLSALVPNRIDFLEFNRFDT